MDQYGCSGPDGSFGYNCLLARRLAERGVRFIHLYHRGWDHHDGIRKTHAGVVANRPIGDRRLVLDLKQRGMLDDTLVVWGGEFGRTPMAQGDGQGDGRSRPSYSRLLDVDGRRRHQARHQYGATDELGYFAVENPVHVHDLHSTMLYLLGVDHERLTYRYQGRDFRLTDVAGKVVKGILA